MGTKFKGHRTGFNETGSNDVTPMFMSEPKTSWEGRGGFPNGKLQRYPGAVADIDDGNRRLSKSEYGEGMDDGVSYRGNPNGFFNGGKVPGPKGGKGPGMDGKRKRFMADNKK
jgi:hypothetical protein